MVASLSTLCLFSILCFGNQRFKPSNATQCEEYNYQEDQVSLNCGTESSLSKYKDLQIHALAFNGTPLDQQQTLLDVNFNHLIIQNAQFPSSSLSTDISTTVDHESLTIVQSSSIAAWSWASFKFKHVYFEDCQLNSADDTTSVKVVTNQFLPETTQSLSMINCRIFSIGQGALGFLNSIRMLTITHNHLTTFSRLVLPEEAPYLWSIDLSNNKLDSLADYLTHELPALKEINLQNNQLFNLPENFFTSVQLSVVNLAVNPFNCDTFCWTFTDNSTPHPSLLDGTECCITPNTEPVILAWNTADSIGCGSNRAKRCQNDTNDNIVTE